MLADLAQLAPDALCSERLTMGVSLLICHASDASLGVSWAFLLSMPI